MTSLDTLVTPTLKAYARNSPPLISSKGEAPPRRTAPFNEEPGFHSPAGLWLYGNAKLLDGKLECVPGAFGAPDQDFAELDDIERQTEEFVLSGTVMVCGIHNPAHQRVALVPLRWGAPRILVMSGGFRHHLGENLLQEPFRAARLWRYQFDQRTDLVISRRAPDRLPTFAHYNPTIDRMISRIAECQWPGLVWKVGDQHRVLA